MKIDWSSSYKPDGSARRPPPNALHGWLAKMRGTLAGNEEVRKRGMKEMRAAQQYKERQREIARKAGRSGILGLFIVKDEPKSKPPSTPQRRLTREDRSMSYSSKKSVRSATSKSSSKRPPPSRRGTAHSSRSMPGSWPEDAPRSRPTPSRKSSRK